MKKKETGTGFGPGAFMFTKFANYMAGPYGPRVCLVLVPA